MKGFSRIDAYDDSIITENDIKELPEPVKNHLVNLLMKPFGLLKAVDAKGNVEDDKSAAAMMLCDMCIGAPPHNR